MGSCNAGSCKSRTSNSNLKLSQILLLRSPSASPSTAECSNSNDSIVWCCLKDHDVLKPGASRELGSDAFRRDLLLSSGTAHHATVEVQAHVLRSRTVQERLSGCNDSVLHRLPPEGKARVLRPFPALVANFQMDLWKFAAREPPEQARLATQATEPVGSSLIEAIWHLTTTRHSQNEVLWERWNFSKRVKKTRHEQHTNVVQSFAGRPGDRAILVRVLSGCMAYSDQVGKSLRGTEASRPSFGTTSFTKDTIAFTMSQSCTL